MYIAITRDIQVHVLADARVHILEHAVHQLIRVVAEGDANGSARRPVRGERSEQAVEERAHEIGILLLGVRLGHLTVDRDLAMTHREVGLGPLAGKRLALPDDDRSGDGLAPVWKKIYIDFGYILQQNPTAQFHELYVEAIPSNSSTPVNIFLDNLKWVTW